MVLISPCAAALIAPLADQPPQLYGLRKSGSGWGEDEISVGRMEEVRQQMVLPGGQGGMDALVVNKKETIENFEEANEEVPLEVRDANLEELARAFPRHYG